jgi:hypothetical protein
MLVHCQTMPVMVLDGAAGVQVAILYADRLPGPPSLRPGSQAI